MENEEKDEVIVDTEEETNEEEVPKEETTKVEKPKRTPQEELEYFEGRAARLRKKLGTEAPESKPTPTEKPSELDYGQLALLRTEGIKGSGEIALFKEIMSETGKGVLDVLDSNYFKSRLSDFREAQETANATIKGKNRSGQTGVTDIDFAVAQFKESGKLPDDFKTRTQVINKVAEAEKNMGVFTGPSVIGPQVQEF